MKYTKGNWLLDHRNESKIYAEDGDLIANVSLPEDRHLIAAAPELLATLKQVSGHLNPDVQSGDLEFIRAIIKQAISKAEGRNK